MRKLYTLVASIVLIAASSDAQAQRANVLKEKPQNVKMAQPTSAISYKTGPQHVPSSEAGSRTDVIYWSEDFSNGFDGQGTNGAWTTSAAQGDLWFIAFPSGEPNGYDPDVPLDLPAYGDSLSNYFGDRSTISSETASNGFAMLDADRWNSTRIDPDLPDNQLGAATQSTPLLSELVSPVMDLSAAQETGAELVVDNYFRLCCTAGDAVFGVQLSFDGGTTWEEEVLNFWSEDPDDVNSDLDTVSVICLATQLAAQEDLTQTRMKFVWDGPQSHYFWMIDDIVIRTPPEVDLLTTETYFNNYPAAFNNIVDDEGFLLFDQLNEDYFGGFEYEIVPEYLLKPLSFGGLVSSCSAGDVTNVVLNITVTNPDGSTQEISTSPETLSGSDEVYLFSEPVFLDAWSGNNTVGEYIVNCTVTSDGDDFRPENNVGPTRTFQVVGETSGSTEGAVVQNGFEAGVSAFTSNTLNQSVLWNVPFVFDDPLVTNTVITHVEVVFMDSVEFSNGAILSTLVGTNVYFNLRSGLVFNDDLEPPVNPSSVLFGSDNFLYGDGELEFTISQEDLYNPETDDEFVWTSFELPSPVLIEAGTIYSPEFRVPAGDQGQGSILVPLLTDNEEFLGAFFRSFDAGTGIVANEWDFFGGVSIPALRIRTTAALSVDKITYEAGIKVTQNWPNPFVSDSRFQFQLDESRQVKIEIRDLAGKLVHSDDLGMVAAGAANDYIIQRNGLAAGVYVYSVITGEDVVTRKMIVE